MSETETVSGTLTAAMGMELKRDRKLWRELVTEAAVKGVEANDAIVRRLGVAWELEGTQATDAFAVDVAAVKEVTNASRRYENSQVKHSSFIDEHGSIADLAKQLEELKQQVTELTAMVRQASHRESVTNGYKWQIHRIKNQTNRIYGDLQND